MNTGTGARLLLCGDVMTGRGIDQILRHPGERALYEPCVRDALDYVRLAEQANGAIPRGVDDAYVWGDALAEFARLRPEARIVNLETAITARGRPQPKGINYRMHPANLGCLRAARIDCCVLANNHVLDWGESGLDDTLAALRAAGFASTGAGRDLAAARAPAELALAGGGRALVFALATASSGVPASWAAGEAKSGVNFLPELSQRAIDSLAHEVAAAKRPGDIAIASIHWGGNWGYRIPDAHVAFAHALIDAAGVDLVHGHSAHHPLALDVHAGKLVLYGCGDFVNDYEGIAGHESYRGELALAWLPEIARADGTLLGLELRAFRRRRFRLERAAASDTRWLCELLGREGERFGTRVRALDGNGLALDGTLRALP